MKLPTILSKPATRPVYKVLPSEIRAKDRKRFDEKREQHLRDLERQKLLKEKEEEKRALEIFEKVRFRARPFIPFPSPPHVRLSRKELTEPETPVFHSEKRVLSRSQKLRMASKILVTK